MLAVLPYQHSLPHLDATGFALLLLRLVVVLVDKCVARSVLEVFVLGQATEPHCLKDSVARGAKYVESHTMKRLLLLELSSSRTACSLSARLCVSETSYLTGAIVAIVESPRRM